MTKLNIKFLNGLKSALGLIGKKKAEAVWFETRFGIHTFFLKFPIDVLVLDENNEVVKLKNNLSPNKIFIWNPKYKKVIELPEGDIARNNIKLGSKFYCR